MLTLIAITAMLILVSTVASAFILHRWHVQWVQANSKTKPTQGRTRQAVLYDPTAGELFTRSERVRKLFADNPEKIWTAEQLVEGVGEPVNDNTLKAVHQILARTLRAGSIERVARGRYRVKDDKHDTGAA